MPIVATCRCPSCGVLNAADQRVCLRCLGPLPAEETSAPVSAATGETFHMYRARGTDAVLLLSRTSLEYAASGMTFATPWSNVARITHERNAAHLWLYQTAQQLRLPSGSSAWFSDTTRAIPLHPFGYPNNDDLRADLCHFAPHLRRFIASAP